MVTLSTLSTCSCKLGQGVPAFYQITTFTTSSQKLNYSDQHLFRTSPHYHKLSGVYTWQEGEQQSFPVYKKVDLVTGKEVYLFRREGGDYYNFL